MVELTPDEGMWEKKRCDGPSGKTNNVPMASGAHVKDDHISRMLLQQELGCWWIALTWEPQPGEGQLARTSGVHYAGTPKKISSIF